MESFTGVKREYYVDGTISSEIYFDNGQKHRIDGPAVIFYFGIYTQNENGKIEHEIYYENGKKHRIGGPAEIKYYVGGTIYSENYYEDGKRHRIGGPAEIVNDQFRHYIYYRDDKYYNPYGPTEFRLNRKNLIIYKDYFSRIKKSLHVKGPAIINTIGIQWGIYGRFKTMQIEDF